MIQKRVELEQSQERMNGLIFDVQYSIDAIQGLMNSDEHLNVILFFF